MRWLFALLVFAMSSTFALDGGLDYQTHSVFARPGTLSDCCNFERGVTQGYDRINGIISFDGFEATDDSNLFDVYMTIFVPGAGLVTALQEGGMFEFKIDPWTTDSSQFRFIVSTVVVDSSDPATVIVTGKAKPVVESSAVGPSVFGGSFGDYYISAYYVNGSLANESFVNVTTFQHATGADISVGSVLGSVTNVPGRTDSDVHFTHLHRDDVYAARDMRAWMIELNTATLDGTRPLAGDSLVVVNADGTRVFATVFRVFADSGWDTGRAIRVIVKAVDDPDYSTAGSNTVYLFTRGGGDMGTMLGGFGAALGEFGEAFHATAIGEVFRLTNNTEAALWRSSTAGWQEVPMLHEVRFRAGASEMADLIGVSRDATISSNSATQVATGLLQGSNFIPTDLRITNPTNAQSPNVTYTGTATVLSYGNGANFASLHVTGFNTDAIPISATIIGIEVEIQRKRDGGFGNVSDAQVCLTGVGSRGLGISFEVVTGSADNKANTGVVWETTNTTKTYGSASDTWGQPVTPAQVKAPDFGVFLMVERAFNAGLPGYNAVAQIDSIRVNIHYLAATSKVFLYNAGSTPADIEADVVNVHVISGSFDDGNAEGIITLLVGTDANNGRIVGAGDEIGSLPASAGTTYAFVADTMYPVSLPSQMELDDNSSMYRAMNANFFGSDDYEAMYAANGAGPAWSYDRHHFIRVHPDLVSGLNKPRHLAKHGDMLALGFENGSALFSVAGSPFNMRGVEGATEVAFGDKVTGLLSLNQDVLGVFCESRIYGLRGLDPAAFQNTIISPNSGAIEYTVVDMGIPIFCDPFGVASLDTTERFGDFLNGRLSHLAWPWLRPRVQVLSSDQTLRVKLAYPARNKNQYRIVCGDGYAMTMTLVGSERDPQFTIQRWHYDDGSTDAVFTPRHISSGIDSQGKERIFATMAYDARWNLEGQQFVYEVDKLWFFTFWNGASFDAWPIQSHLVTTWTDEESPGGLKQFDMFRIFGRSQFPVTFQVGRAVNYQLTTDAAGDAQNMVDCAFGVSGEIVPPIAYNRMTTAHLAIEGFNVALRFEANAEDTPQFTLSAVQMTSNNRGPSRGQLR